MRRASVRTNNRQSASNASILAPIIAPAATDHSLERSRLMGTEGDTRPYQKDTNLNPHLRLRTEFSRADTFLLAVFLVGLIRSASIRFPRAETAISHASSANSIPLAGLLSPNT